MRCCGREARGLQGWARDVPAPDRSAEEKGCQPLLLPQIDPHMRRRARTLVACPFRFQELSPCLPKVFGASLRSEPS